MIPLADAPSGHASSWIPSWWIPSPRLSPRRPTSSVRSPVFVRRVADPLLINHLVFLLSWTMGTVFAFQIVISDPSSSHLVLFHEWWDRSHVLIFCPLKVQCGLSMVSILCIVWFMVCGLPQYFSVQESKTAFRNLRNQTIQFHNIHLSTTTITAEYLL